MKIFLTSPTPSPFYFLYLRSKYSPESQISVRCISLLIHHKEKFFKQNLQTLMLTMFYFIYRFLCEIQCDCYVN
jgi:hypothetical protein